ncbi:hypothetical protein [Cohnella panacarvi]|uniref:hypothetical protein n=1 Tax=Cohnella panacarvi TaxID=400776 RepID=UPI00047C43A2|nr:hypothetical protein [Cohnella panacarvi]
MVMRNRDEDRMVGFEEAFEAFLAEQRRNATGMRLEMLNKDLTGTKKLLEMLWPVLGSFEDLILEYEVTSLSGVKIYVDVFHRVWRIVFEADGFVVHAEKITRDRFSFERMRVRTFMNLGCRYMPFSWDELDKKPDACRRSVYEMLGRFGNGRIAHGGGLGWMELPVYERELIRCAWLHNRPFGMKEACEWLQLKDDTARLVIRSLISRGILQGIGGSLRRAHLFQLTELAGGLR